MKTTLEIPESLLERAENAAECQGIPLGDLVTNAISEKLRRQSPSAPTTGKPWLKSFGTVEREDYP